jgi:mannose-6-phosphate isomerase-like protein (cupin superfamily)
MTSPHGRPVPVGNYEVVADHEWPTASVRILRLFKGGPIQSHVHHRSMQIYVGLQGRSIVTIDGVERTLGPNEAAAVWASSVHSATAGTDESMLMNISVPPLGEDDQVPYVPSETPSMRLPTAGTDVED